MLYQEKKLIEYLQNGSVVPVVGAGVSYATAGLPGWKDLIKDGLQFSRDLNLDVPDAARFERCEQLLTANSLTQAATLLKELLHAPDSTFAEWLKHKFHQPVIQSTQLIQSIHNLCTDVVLTTNYDTLLSTPISARNKEILNWKEHELIQSSLNDGGEMIIHLHGIYRDPDSIILSSIDYERLAEQHGYKTILQNFWMNKHLLFIGCSRDGVLDEDFSTAINFLTKWFPKLAHEHFILVHENEIRKGTHLELISKANIHAISYGNEHENLPKYIDSINPNVEKAANKIRAFQEMAESELKQTLNPTYSVSQIEGPIQPENKKVETFLSKVLPPNTRWVGSKQIEIVDELLAKYNAHVSSKKERFHNYQAIIKGLVELSQLNDTIAQWEQNSRSVSRLDLWSYTILALTSFECLQRIPKDILEDISVKKRGVIHGSYYTGYLGHFVNQGKQLLSGSYKSLHEHYQNDAYYFENLKRIIQSLRNFLILDVESLYSELNSANTAEFLPSKFFAVATTKAITLRDEHDISKILASLPLESNLDTRGIACLMEKEEVYVYGYNAKYCYKWNPLRDLTWQPIFQAAEGEYISRAFFYAHNNSIIALLYSDSRLIKLRDGLLFKESPIFDDFEYVCHSIRGKCLYELNEIFINTKNGAILFKRDAHNVRTAIISIEDLIKIIKEIPEVQKMIINIPTHLHAHFEITSLISHPAMKVVNLTSRTFLVLRLQINIPGDGDQNAILIFEETIAGLQWYCSVFTGRQQSITFDLCDGDSELTLFIGYLDRFNDDQVLVNKITLIENKIINATSEEDYLNTGKYPGDIIHTLALNNSVGLFGQTVRPKELSSDLLKMPYTEILFKINFITNDQEHIKFEKHESILSLSRFPM